MTLKHKIKKKGYPIDKRQRALNGHENHRHKSLKIYSYIVLTLSAFRILLVFVTQLLVNILSARLINCRHVHASGSQPQEVVRSELINLREEAVESIQIMLDYAPFHNMNKEKG